MDPQLDVVVVLCGEDRRGSKAAGCPSFDQVALQVLDLCERNAGAKRQLLREFIPQFGTYVEHFRPFDQLIAQIIEALLIAVGNLFGAGVAPCLINLLPGLTKTAARAGTCQ